MGGKSGTKFSNFCSSRVATQIRVPSLNKSVSNKSNKSDSNNGEKVYSDASKPISTLGRRIMIVVDSSIEAKCALQWVLSHTVQSQDVLVLLYVAKPFKQGDQEPNDEPCPRNYEFLYTMKNMCHMKRPEVQIEFTLVEGKSKGPKIVEEAKKQGITLLVLGQRKRSMIWWLFTMWARRKVGGTGGVVEYCIKNATCMTIAVRRKSKKLGGYAITTKRHKDFWLLA